MQLTSGHGTDDTRHTAVFMTVSMTVSITAYEIRTYMTYSQSHVRCAVCSAVGEWLTALSGSGHVATSFSLAFVR